MKGLRAKAAIAAAAILLAPAALTSCNKDVGLTGTLSFSYVAVDSPLAGKGYYHIKRWKEYSPEGGTLGKPYVGLEFTTASSERTYYFYEIGLQYVFTSSYDPAFGKAIQ